jgi:hypothetical protein
VFTDAIVDGNVPGGIGHVDFCASSGVTCPGGQGQGLNSGGTASGTFRLDFGVAAALTQLVLDDFFVRYQGIAGSTLGTAGVGVEVSPVPIPAVGAALPLIVGFGGYMGWRKRRKQAAA